MLTGTLPLSIEIHVSDLKPFFGSHEDGLRAARIDFEQYEISRIISYRGCPLRRSTISFLVLFTGGDEIWKPFDSEMSNTVHFERFVAAHPDLEPLLHPAVIHCSIPPLRHLLFDHGNHR